MQGDKLEQSVQLHSTADCLLNADCVCRELPMQGKTRNRRLSSLVCTLASKETCVLKVYTSTREIMGGSFGIWSGGERLQHQDASLSSDWLLFLKNEGVTKDGANHCVKRRLLLRDVQLGAERRTFSFR